MSKWQTTVFSKFSFIVFDSLTLVSSLMRYSLTSLELWIQTRFRV